MIHIVLSLTVLFPLVLVTVNAAAANTGVQIFESLLLVLEGYIHISRSRTVVLYDVFSFLGK